MHKTVGTFSILSTKVSSSIIYKRNFGDFLTMPRLGLSCMIEWIDVHNLVLDRYKTQTVKFINKEVENLCLLCYYAVRVGNFLPTYGESLSYPSSSIKDY